MQRLRDAGAGASSPAAAGYAVRQVGSHLRLRHDERPEDLPIAMHRGDVPKGTLVAIIKQAGLTQAEFQELL